MKYTKPPLPISEQIRRLKSRGLRFENETKAAHYLSNISYYRLRAYTYPFQDNSNVNHPFTQDISFEQIMELYVFDRKLRFLVFNALEKIEIALRTKIVYEMSLGYGSHWQENPDLFKVQHYFDSNLCSIADEVERSKEDFVNHYFTTYVEPLAPPSWMSLEVVSMGLLSQIHSNIKEIPEKQKILFAFGHKRYASLRSWIHAFVGLRNVCAHHGRLWNRRFTISPQLPYNMSYHFLNNTRVQKNKLYALLSCMNYILRIVSPDANFVSDIKTHLSCCSLVNLHQMGFPEDWEDEPLWDGKASFKPISRG